MNTNVEFMTNEDKLTASLASQVARVKSPAETAAWELGERYGWYVRYDEDRDLVMHHSGRNYSKLLWVYLSSDGLITGWMVNWWPVGDSKNGGHRSQDGLAGLADALMDPDGDEE